MRVLVTGFGNFGSVAENPSEVLVKQLRQESRSIDTFIFKGYKNIDENLESILNKYKPDVILMFGLASKTSFVRLERIARCPEKISGRKQYRGTLPLKKVYESLTDRNIEVKYSDSAGTYWCNYLFYKVCQLRSDNKNSQHGFIHIPNPLAYEKKYRKRLDLDTLGLTVLDSVTK